MAHDEFPLSGPALSALHAWLPDGLTVDQTERVIKAAREMGRQVAFEAAQSATALRVIRDEAKRAAQVDGSAQ